MTVPAVWFTAPREVTVRETPVPDPGSEEVRVSTDVSAISTGTELLIYRGDAPSDLPADPSLEALSGGLSFPVEYGYAAVGQVTAVGTDVDEAWLDRQVFAFRPHTGAFTARPDELIPVPEWCAPSAAAFLPNVETAVNMLQDGRPIVGERVAVFGQGVIGLLVTGLLAQFPLASVTTVDFHPRRRALSERLGADRTLDPEDGDPADTLRDQFGAPAESDAPNAAGADLVYELSGSPDALDTAIDATGYGGRVVVGSWYGTKPAALELGDRFHRGRIRVISSQVSTIAPELRGRWTKDRRLGVAWDRLGALDPERLITHRIPVEEAPEAYRLLDERPDETVQILLTY